MNTSFFNDRQQRLIDRCKRAGYGWAKFATSVERSGKCSAMQEDTLCSMVQRIDQAESRKAKSYRNYADHDISDSEAPRSGDFF